jgi:Ca2+-binding EF-hand superfamily protein
MSKTTVLIVAIVLGTFSAQSARAADQKQCADQFKAVDLNNDGTIVRSEMGSSPNMIPASLSNKSRITRKDYMAACTKVAAKK